MRGRSEPMSHSEFEMRSKELIDRVELDSILATDAELADQISRQERIAALEQGVLQALINERARRLAD